MKILKALLLFSLLSTLAGCYTVRTVDNPDEATCNLVTKELEINFSDELIKSKIQGTNTSGTSEGALLLLVAVPATSFVVSGSISVLGNVVHWVEKQGRCEDSAVRTFTSSITDGVVSAGGMVMDTSESFFNWLQGK